MNFCKSAYIECWLKPTLHPSTSSVLDLCCGKGGDVQKLASFQTYVGVDVSPNAIQEAKRRYPDKDFRVGSLLQPLRVDPVDCAVCMLALHYGGEALGTTMQTISSCLKPGGSLLAIVLDSDVVHAHPHGIEPMKVHSWETVAGDARKRVWVSLEGTMTPLPEWLLDDAQLAQACKDAGMQLVKSENVLQGLQTMGWQQWLEPGDARLESRSVLESLKAQYYGKHQWDTKHWQFVQQYKAYLFQKRA